MTHANPAELLRHLVRADRAIGGRPAVIATLAAASAVCWLLLGSAVIGRVNP